MSGPFGAAPAGLVRVEVRLKGALADRVPGGRAHLELPDGTTVDGVVEALGLPRASYIFAVNGAAVRTARLHDGDRVQIYPPMAGG